MKSEKIWFKCHYCGVKFSFKDIEAQNKHIESNNINVCMGCAIQATQG